jgi:hypothetical protein
LVNNKIACPKQSFLLFASTTLINQLVIRVTFHTLFDGIPQTVYDYQPISNTENNIKSRKTLIDRLKLNIKAIGSILSKTRVLEAEF